MFALLRNAAWLEGMRDAKGKAYTVARIARLQFSEHWGDAKPVGGGIIELRIDHGPAIACTARKSGS